MANLRVAVIGAGAMGANHVRVLRELPGAELVAVADADEARLREQAQGANAYADHERLLAGEKIDAAVVAVPTRLHLEVGLACIERGVPVLIEKPLGADVDECLRLERAARDRGVPLVVGHVERFNPAVQELKRRLDAGEAGRVLLLSAVRVGPFFPRGRDVGVVHDLATHDIDIVRWLFGCDVESVEAETRRGERTEFEDALSAVLRFEDGRTAMLKVDWLSDEKMRQITVLSEQGMFIVDELRQELRFFEGAAGDVSPDDEPTSIEAFPGAGEAPLRDELATFIRVAAGDAEPPVTAADAVAVMRVVEALIASADAGDAVRLTADRTAS